MTRQRGPTRRRTLRSGALPDSRAMMAAIVGAVLIVAATASVALSQDTPAEDAPSQDTSTEDAPSQDVPAEDVPAEDASSEDTPAEDALAEDTPADDALVDMTEDSDVDDSGVKGDPITGAPSAGGRLAGSWLGVPHHTVADAPTLVLECSAGRLEVMVHTGGAVVAVYGHGVPVAYRVGETVEFQEWNQFAPAEGPSGGVSVPPWLVGGFVALLGANPSGDFLIRMFGHDGAPVGTASFDHEAIAVLMAPVPETCPPPGVTPADDGG